MEGSGLGLGATKAGAAPDPLTFVKKPTVILRLVALVSVMLLAL